MELFCYLQRKKPLTAQIKTKLLQFAIDKAIEKKEGNSINGKSFCCYHSIKCESQCLLNLFSAGKQFTSTDDNNLTELGCKSSGKYAIIVHGWQESIETEWVDDLVHNLLEYRGGCIIVMDYSNHSVIDDYFVLVRKFDALSEVLLKKLHQLEAQGFHPNNLFMYGFSFGAQLAVNVGTLYGERRIAEIDGKFFNALSSN